ncbi:inositol 2-dehydrogenase [Calditerricola yamamurae]|jgi:Predicted dehydrogenases and related proteins
MTVDHVRIGIIGAGRIGKMHAEILCRHPRVRLVAVADVAADRLRDWAAQWGIPRVTADYRDILADDAIDAVLICTPTDTHVSLIKEAAAAGKHIFCEKPVSPDLGQTREALAAVRAAGVKLQVGFNRRFDPSFRRVRQWVREGKVGHPHVVKITSRDPAPPPADYIRLSGGLFFDLTIHDFDLARFLVDSEVEEVYAAGGVLVDPVFAQYGDVDTAVVMLRFQNGALGVIDNSRQAVFGYDQRVEVFGSAGCVTADNAFPTTVQALTAAAVERDKPHRFFAERYRDAYLCEVESFVNCVLRDEPAPVSGEDSLQAERIAHAAKRSLAEKRPVKVAEVDSEGARPPASREVGT